MPTTTFNNPDFFFYRHRSCASGITICIIPITYTIRMDLIKCYAVQATCDGKRFNFGWLNAYCNCLYVGESEWKECAINLSKWNYIFFNINFTDDDEDLVLYLEDNIYAYDYMFEWHEMGLQDSSSIMKRKSANLKCIRQ